MVNEEDVRETLMDIYDPELGVNVVDLGLVYNIEIVEGDKVRVDMTLTSPGCPMGPAIMRAAQVAIKSIPGVKDAEVYLVWSPPWTAEMMSQDAKDELGIWD